MTVLTFLTALVAAVSITIGVFSTPLPKSLGFYSLIARKVNPPRLVGWLPVFVQDDAWGFTFEQLYSTNRSLKGQTALVTGANSGTGYETALALSRLGASVTMACRNMQRCEAAAERIRADKFYREQQQDNSNDGDTIHTMLLDTSSLKSVQAFAKAYRSNTNIQKLDMLFLNAGIPDAPPDDDGSVALSEDGIELVFATNHVGHHLLYQSLEPLLLKSNMARVVLTSSAGSFHSYDYKVATDLQTLNSVPASSLRERQLIYGQSKLAQVFFAQEATRRLKLAGHENVYVNAAHPGVVSTGIFDNIATRLSPSLQKVLAYLRENAMWTAAEGALTLLYLGVATDELVSKNIKGKYYHPQSVQVTHPLTQHGTEELQQKLWYFCDDLVKDFVYVAPEHDSDEKMSD